MEGESCYHGYCFYMSGRMVSLVTMVTAYICQAVWKVSLVTMVTASICQAVWKVSLVTMVTASICQAVWKVSLVTMVTASICQAKLPGTNSPTLHNTYIGKSGPPHRPDKHCPVRRKKKSQAIWKVRLDTASIYMTGRMEGEGCYSIHMSEQGSSHETWDVIAKSYNISRAGKIRELALGYLILCYYDSCYDMTCHTMR